MIALCVHHNVNFIFCDIPASWDKGLLRHLLTFCFSLLLATFSLSLFILLSCHNQLSWKWYYICTRTVFIFKNVLSFCYLDGFGKCGNGR